MTDDLWSFEAPSPQPQPQPLAPGEAHAQRLTREAEKARLDSIEKEARYQLGSIHYHPELRHDPAERARVAWAEAEARHEQGKVDNLRREAERREVDRVFAELRAKR